MKERAKLQRGNSRRGKAAHNNSTVCETPPSSERGSSSSLLSAGSRPGSLKSNHRDTLLERKEKIASRGSDRRKSTHVVSSSPGATAVYPQARPSVQFSMEFSVDGFDGEEMNQENTKAESEATEGTTHNSSQPSITAEVIDEEAIAQQIKESILEGTVEASAAETEDEVKERQNKFRKMVIIVTTLLTILAVILGVVLSRRSKSTQLPTPSPTSAPTALIQSEEEEALIGLIKNLLPKSGVELEKGRDTPQFRALLSVLSKYKEYTIEVLLFRYVLAVLYYSTGGEHSWVRNDNWVTEKPLCEWYVTCKECNGCQVGRDSMIYVELIGNGLKGTLPEEFGMLPQAVQQIDLSDNELEGYISDDIFDSAGMLLFNVASNPALGGDISKITSLLNIHTIDLSHTNVTGSLPSPLRNLSALKKFWISSTGITGTLPTAIGEMTSLTSFIAADVQFTGTIPTEIGLCTSLYNIEVNGRLHGTIPDEMYGLTELTVLNLEQGSFQGTISSLIGSLTGLRRLQLSGNQLTGTIPTEMGLLTSLAQLAIDDNKLTGSIPAELENLTDSLTGLWLRNNQLTGTIPSWVNRIPDTFLTGNNFTEVRF